MIVDKSNLKIPRTKGKIKSNFYCLCIDKLELLRQFQLNLHRRAALF